MAPKILLQKEKKFFVEDLQRSFVKDKKEYFVKDTAKDFHTPNGVVKKEDFTKEDGSIITTHSGTEFLLYTPHFLDLYRRIKRLPQIIPFKDIGCIIAMTGVNKESVIVDGGTGSGALACFLAHIAKEVISYEIKEEHRSVAQDNISFLGITNLTLKNKSLYDGIDEEHVNLITLDLPEPWLVLPHAEKALQYGCFIVSYSPTVPQVQDFVNALEKYPSFVHVRTIELIEREWEVRGRKVRPKSEGIGHSGFLTFVRKL